MVDTDLGGPRPHHYEFAHRFMPGVFYADPPGFFALLRQKGIDILHMAWLYAAKHLKPEFQLPDDGLTFAFYDLGAGYATAIITLPQPQGMTEAFFIAPALWPARGADPAPDAQFLTLELGQRIPSRELCGVFGAWTSGGAHINMGIAPAWTLDAFQEHIRSLALRA